MLHLTVNGRKYNEVIVDTYYMARHGDHMTDELILKLVRKLDNLWFVSEHQDENGFQYYVTEPLYFENKPYRLVWLTHPEETYIGIRNAFRIGPKLRIC